MNCLDDTTLMKFIDGKMLPYKFEAIEKHIDECEYCRKLIAMVVKIYFNSNDICLDSSPEELYKQKLQLTPSFQLEPAQESSSVKA